MKMKTAAIAALAAFAINTFAQGSLTPPGSPAETMKTLQQVEPRTPVSGAMILSQSGSYYLTGNVTNGGITVSASDVALDLNGFIVSGVAATGNGISLSIGVHNVLIENGTIRDCSENGIVAGKTTGCIFHDLRVLNNSNAGISGGYDTVIENCAVRDNGGYGIYGVSGSRIVGNIIEDNDVGLHLSGTGNYVEGNQVKDNNDNYSFPSTDNQLNLLLCQIPETLDWPCAVKLAGTLTCSQTGVDGITVNSDNVTIEMDGHALIGPGESSGHGVYQHYDYRNLTVANGKVVRWGAIGKGGLYLSGHNGILEGMAAQTNYYGIHVGDNWSMRACVAEENTCSGIDIEYNNTLENCSSRKNDRFGICAESGNALQNCADFYNTQSGVYAEDVNSIQNCSAYYNSSTGIRVMDGNTIHNCAAYDNTGSGFYARVGNNMQSCEAYYNDGNGIQVYSGNNIRNCAARNNKGHGFSSEYSNFIIGCLASMNGYAGGEGAGIYVHNGNYNLIEGNNVNRNNGCGIQVEGSGNFITRNICTANTTNWVVAAGNVCLVVDAAITGSAISGDSGGVAPGSTDPNANFTY